MAGNVFSWRRGTTRRPATRSAPSASREIDVGRERERAPCLGDGRLEERAIARDLDVALVDVELADVADVRVQRGVDRTRVDRRLDVAVRVARTRELPLDERRPHVAA